MQTNFRNKHEKERKEEVISYQSVSLSIRPYHKLPRTKHLGTPNSLSLNFNLVTKLAGCLLSFRFLQYTVTGWSVCCLVKYETSDTF